MDAKVSVFVRSFKVADKTRSILTIQLASVFVGIGTGWSTNIPPHSPIDVLNYIRAKLYNAPEIHPIRPFAKGFEGTFEVVSSKNRPAYTSVGRVSKQTNTSVLIDELPLKCWTEDYKVKTLLKMREQAVISGFVENHTTSKVSFTVNLKTANHLAKMEQKGLESAFKLKSNLPTTNMHAFDADCVMTKFETAEAIVDAYFPIRMALYEDRKSVLESEMSYNAALFRNKARFIESVIAGEIDLLSGRQSKKQTASRLEELDFQPLSALNEIRNDNAPFRRRDQPPTIEEAASTDKVQDSEFDYLLNMPLSSLTSEKVASLQEDAKKKEKELKATQATTAVDLWRQDLDRLEPLL